MTPDPIIKRSLVCAVLSLTSSCVDTGSASAAADLYLQGTRPGALQARDGWELELQRAELAFGPLTLCPGTTPGELCETARAEWVGTALVDALDEDAKRVGQLVGSRGPVGSWMYDLGIVSLLSRSEAFESDAARALGGYSALLAACATKDEREVCFEVGVRVVQSSEAEQGIPVVRVSGDRSHPDFGRAKRLTLRFDPAAWTTTIDIERLMAEAKCEASCAEMVSVSDDSQTARALRSALENVVRPDVEWDDR